ncbi:hypothetical protein IAD21_02783 [Abditibacteriota bacterium]|nr:hypothetical protein IAD21_02783 [Abditibacteriota bacterium]
MLSSSCDHRFAYGLRIASDFPLSDLPTSPPTDRPDVRIELAGTLLRSEIERLVTIDSPIENVLSFEQAFSRVLFTEVGRFTVRGGTHVLVEPIEGTSASSWRLPLLGSILALLLEQRTLLALHAGAVEMSGPDGTPIACAFAGEKGQGKSTLGASLSLAGFPLLCDDVLGLEIPSNRSNPPIARVGFGGIKLVPDAVRAILNIAPEELPHVSPELSDGAELDKRYFVAPLAQAERPLRHVFLLASHEADPHRDDITLRSLAPQEALALLLPHTFAARWGELYLKGAVRSAHFKACAQVVASCHIWELSRRRDLKLLPQTIELIVTTAREVALIG